MMMSWIDTKVVLGQHLDAKELCPSDPEELQINKKQLFAAKRKELLYVQVSWQVSLGYK